MKKSFFVSILILSLLLGAFGFGLLGKISYTSAQKTKTLTTETKIPKIIDQDKNKIFDNLGSFA